MNFFSYRLYRTTDGYQLCRVYPDMQEYGLSRPRKVLSSKDVSQNYPERLLELLTEMPAPLEKQIEYSWSQNNCASSLVLKEDKLTVYRTNVMNSTAGVRGKIAVSQGLHVWEVNWPENKRGSHATIGVGTSSTPLFSNDYVNLIGNTKDSWGWDLVHCKAIHNVTIYNQGRTYPMLHSRKEMYRVPSTFFMVLDMDVGTLAFIAEGEYLGIAFEGLQGRALYPFIGCVFGSCEISLKYIGGTNEEIPSLKQLCRRFIRQTIKQDKLETEINNMQIPEELKSYIFYKNSKSAYNLRVLKAIVEDKENDNINNPNSS